MSLKVLGYNYEVSITDNVDFIGAAGRFHCTSQKIQIAGDLCKQAKESAVLHEIIEALNYHLEMDLPHQTIMSLEAGLYQVLTDNGIDLSGLALQSNDD